MAPRASLRNVSVWRWNAARGNRVPIIAQLEWDIGAGERWALLGPNGAGKTTLLTILGAVDFPSRGEVVILGRTLGRTDVFALRRRIGFVDARAGRRFAPALTLQQVVATGGTQTIGYFAEQIDQPTAERADGLVDLFGLTALRDRRFLDCSHGERTRALIARALVPQPELLLLDEPGSGLDLPGRETLLAALDDLVAEQPELALVTTTHHLEELPASTTHALLLAEGRVVAAGPIEETLVSDRLSACFRLPIDVRRDGGRWSAVATRHGGLRPTE